MREEEEGEVGGRIWPWTRDVIGREGLLGRDGVAFLFFEKRSE